MLWHRRLRYISKQCLERLTSQGTLESLNMSNFDVCIECIKGKTIDKREKGANRCKNVLELIHTYICGPFPKASWNGQAYFVSFIDDYSHYGYLYLIREKFQSLNNFILFKPEVENQLGKKIKAMRSDYSGEYYGRFDGLVEHFGHFSKYLAKCGIVRQYTIHGNPH